MKRAILIAATALLMPLTAQAEFSYSWFEIGYIDTEAETGGVNETGNGFDVQVNFLAGDALYITGHANEVEYEDQTDVDRFGLGFGLHNDPAAAIGLYATLTYEDLETPFKDDDGFGASVGARYQWQEDIELFASYDYASYEDTDGGFINIGGVWAFSKNYALVAEYSDGDFTFDENDVVNPDENELERQDLRVSLRVQF